MLNIFTINVTNIIEKSSRIKKIKYRTRKKELCYTTKFKNIVNFINKSHIFINRKFCSYLI